MTQATALEFIRSARTSFFRLPLRGELGPAPDAVLMGVPYDGGTTYRPGARFAPFRVREASLFLSSFHPELGVDVFARIAAVDGGNVPAPSFGAAAMRAAVEAMTDEIVGVGAAPVLIGGDHSITLPALRAVARTHGPVALLHIDAHFDTSDGSIWGERHHHGTPIRDAIEEGLVDTTASAQIGVRGPWRSQQEAAWSERHGVRVFSTHDVTLAGPEVIAAAVSARVGRRPLYVSFDVDALDPAYAPGTGTPVPGGLSSREAFGLLRGLAGLRVVGGDVVEVCPPCDRDDATALVAAHLAFELLALLAVREPTAAG
jgi:agmatinase